MSELDKVVYVADYIEHNRNFRGVDRELRSWLNGQQSEQQDL